MNDNTKKPRNYPLESFGPELLSALLKGAKEPFEIGPMKYREAVRMQLRLQQLRRQLQMSGHELWPVVARTKTSLLWGPRAGFPDVETQKNSRGYIYPKNRECLAKLLIGPRDSEFAAILNAAGVKADELKLDPLHPTSDEGITAGDFLDQIIGSKNGNPGTRK